MVADFRTVVLAVVTDLLVPNEFFRDTDAIHVYPCMAYPHLLRYGFVIVLLGGP